MGPRNVRRYALTCERFGAAKAAEMGLVHEVCPTGGLDAAAAPVIDQLLLSAPIAMTETKQVILDHANITLSDEYFEELVAQHAAKRQSDEAAEGLKSFAEKRNPSWYTGTA
jgi:methylglutaconyl-CoA hydratase